MSSVAQQPAEVNRADLAINAAVGTFSVRFRGVSGPGNDVLIFERLDPTQEYPGGVPALANAIIKTIVELGQVDPIVSALLQGKNSVGIV